MEKISLKSTVFSCLLILSVAVATAEPVSEDAVRTEARAASHALMKRLGARLKMAMQNGGALAAVEVCHLEAQSLTSQTSADLNLDVGRTALKVRNPANAPDGWESAQLQQFEADLAAGASADQLEALELFEDSGGKSYWRYMKPIMTGGVCLNCHGESLQPEVANAIASRYPVDQAVGFQVGDLRGAFTIKIEQ